MAWSGRLFFRAGRLLYVGELAPTDAHVHHAFQIMLGGTVGIADGAGRKHSCRAAVIPADAEHAIADGAEYGAMLLLDADDRVGRQLRRLHSSPSVLDWARAGEALPRIEAQLAPRSWTEADGLIQRVVRALVGEQPAPAAVHPAVVRVLRRLNEDREADVSLAALARHAGISAGRLAHLFPQHVGIPLRAYLRWRRLVHAAEWIQRGQSMTAAAHLAGFSDGPHLTHAFRRMFGMAPSEMVGTVDWRLPEAG